MHRFALIVLSLALFACAAPAPVPTPDVTPNVQPLGAGGNGGGDAGPAPVALALHFGGWWAATATTGGVNNAFTVGGVNKWEDTAMAHAPTVTFDMTGAQPSSISYDATHGWGVEAWDCAPGQCQGQTTTGATKIASWDSRGTTITQLETVALTAASGVSFPYTIAAGHVPKLKWIKFASCDTPQAFGQVY